MPDNVITNNDNDNNTVSSLGQSDGAAALGRTKWPTTVSLWGSTRATNFEPRSAFTYKDYVGTFTFTSVPPKASDVELLLAAAEGTRHLLCPQQHSLHQYRSARSVPGKRKYHNCYYSCL